MERLAAEQSALRRVATLVAREHSPDELFATLVEELGVLLEVDATAILRYEGDSSATVVAGWSDRAIMLQGWRAVTARGGEPGRRRAADRTSPEAPSMRAHHGSRSGRAGSTAGSS